MFFILLTNKQNKKNKSNEVYNYTTINSEKSAGCKYFSAKVLISYAEMVLMAFIES